MNRNVDIDPNTVLEYANKLETSLAEITDILEKVNNETSKAEWESNAATAYRETYSEFKNNNYNQFVSTMDNCIKFLKTTANAYIEAEQQIGQSAN